MDLAFDHIPEVVYPKAGQESGETPPEATSEGPSSLNEELQDAYKAISSSTWGMKIGGFLGNVMKQAS